MEGLRKEYYRRRLPHYQPQYATFFVTFRLAGSLPNSAIAQLVAERAMRNRLIHYEKDEARKKDLILEERRRYFGHFDSFLDKARSGNRWLANHRIAGLVKEAIHFRNQKEYDLDGYCIMPNHVHMVFTPLAEPVRRRVSSPYLGTHILGNLKWYTALKANRILNRTGQFWQHESYDHAVKDGDELNRIIQYVAYNPVNAGLCKEWREWEWTFVKEGCF